jgi:hypothetical protein
MAWYDDILGTGSNIFGARPADYLVGKEGLLNESEQQKLSQRALTSGLLGTAITYLAQPKNQRYGSALPYLGKAFLTGMGQSQDVYDKATQDYLTKTKIEDIKATKAKEANLKSILSGLSLDPNKPVSRETIQGLYKTGDPASIDIANKILNAETDMQKLYAPAKTGYKILSKDEVKALNEKGYNLNPAATWQQSPTDQYEPVSGTMPTTKDVYKTLSSDEATKAGLDTSRGQKYQVNSSGNINLIGGQMDLPVKPTQTITDKDKSTVKVVLEKMGFPNASNITTTAIASRANKIMTDTGVDQLTAIQQATAEAQKSKAITKKTGFFTDSTDFNITPSEVKTSNEVKPAAISEAEYKKLPIGASYIAPNGQTLIKK